ncbi:MAG: hypothetical protein ACRDA8_09235 [Shewanella sp.]
MLITRSHRGFSNGNVQVLPKAQCIGQRRVLRRGALALALNGAILSAIIGDFPREIAALP